VKNIPSLILGVLSICYITACELYPMEPLCVTACTPKEPVVETGSLKEVSLSFSADAARPLVESAFTLEEDGIPLQGSFVWTGNRSVQFRPVTPFSDQARYRITLTTTAEDSRGNSLEKLFIHDFRGSADTIRPQLDSLSPQDNSRTDTVTPDLEFTFSEPMDRSSIIDGITITPAVAGFFDESDDRTTFRFVLTTALLWQTRYTITILEQVRDIHGNEKGSREHFSFFTGTDSLKPDIEAVSVTNPALTGLFPDDPQDGTETITPGIEKDAAIVIRFSAPVNRENAEGNITITPPFSYATSWNGTGDELTLSPRNPFSFDVVYTLSLNSGITDLQGNSIAEPAVYKFRTNGVASRPPEIVHVSFTNNFSEEKPVLPLTTLEPLSVLTFHSAVCENACYGFFDLHVIPAYGASITLPSLYAALSLSAENAAITPVACQTGSGITFMAEELPPQSVPGAQVLRIIVDVDNSSTLYNDKSGKITLSLNQSFCDTRGNHLPGRWLMDIYTTN